MVVPGRVVRIELISFFNLYPETVATSEEMARRLKRGTEQVVRQMNDLVELGILEQTIDGERVLYSYIAPMCVNLMSRKAWGKAEGDAPGSPPASGSINGMGQGGSGKPAGGEEEEKERGARKSMTGSGHAADDRPRGMMEDDRAATSY